MFGYSKIAIRSHKATYDPAADELVLSLMGDGILRGARKSGTVFLMRFPRRLSNNGLYQLYILISKISGSDAAFSPTRDDNFIGTLSDVVATCRFQQNHGNPSMLAFSSESLCEKVDALWRLLMRDFIALSASTTLSIEKSYRSSYERYPLNPAEPEGVTPVRRRANLVLAYLATHPESPFENLQKIMGCSETVGRNTISFMESAGEIRHCVKGSTRKRFYSLPSL